MLSTATTSYAPPTITRVAPPTARTNGGDILRVDGYDFGLPDASSYTHVLFHGQRLEPLKTLISPVAVDVDGIMRYNHSVWFVVPNFPGQGRDKEIKIATGTNSGSDEQVSLPVSFTYIPPAIHQISTFEG